jgi:dihydrofolate reductase
VVTRKPDYRPEGAEVTLSLEAPITTAVDVDEIRGVRGARLCTIALPCPDRPRPTLIDARVEGDAHFPQIDESAWRETESK